MITDREIKNSAKLSLQDIRRCLEILADCDRNLKGSGLDARLLLERCITELMLVRQPAY